MKLLVGLVLIGILCTEKIKGMQDFLSEAPKQVGHSFPRKKLVLRRRSTESNYSRKKKRRSSTKNSCTREKNLSLPVVLEEKYVRRAPIKSNGQLIGYADHEELVALDILRKNIIGKLLFSDDLLQCSVLLEGYTIHLQWISFGGWWNATEELPVFKERRSVSCELLRVSNKESGASGFSDDEDVFFEFQFSSVSPVSSKSPSYSIISESSEDSQESYGFDAESIGDVIDDLEVYGFNE